MGAGLLAPSLLAAVDCAFSVDGARPVGTVITRALGQTSFSFVIHGRAAHAAANPEAGISAIRVAAEIVAALLARPAARGRERLHRRHHRRRGHRSPQPGAARRGRRRPRRRW